MAADGLNKKMSDGTGEDSFLVQTLNIEAGELGSGEECCERQIVRSELIIRLCDKFWLERRFNVQHRCQLEPDTYGDDRHFKGKSEHDVEVSPQARERAAEKGVTL